MAKVYVQDLGTRMTFDTGVNISAATALSLLVRKPDGTEAEWAATASGSTALYRDVQAGDISDPGVYFLQPKVVTPAGTWLAETVRLRVYDVFR